MAFPKFPDLSDAQAQVLSFIMMPLLIWVVMDDIWTAALEAATVPFASRSFLD